MCGYVLINDVNPSKAARIYETSVSAIDHVICSSANQNRCKVTVKDITECLIIDSHIHNSEFKTTKTKNPEC